MRGGQFIKSCAAALIGLGIGSCVALFAGESPLRVIQVLATGAFGSWYDFGMTLVYATPLIFTGLSVSVAYRAGLFNIGAEGQLLWGAMAAASVGVLFPNIQYPWAPLLAGICAFLGGALWGGLAGWIRAYRGGHEVIVTIMLNFIASAMTSWITLYLLKNPETQNPETIPIGNGYLLQPFGLFDGAAVSVAVGVALVAILWVDFFLKRSALGFELMAVGQSESAARFNRVSVPRTQLIAMVLSGGLAGWVAIPEILGNLGRFRLEFSPGYGFMGIAVALLARGKPWGVLISALLFGALHKGAADLDIEMNRVTRDLALILQGLVILAVSVDWRFKWIQTLRSR